ncbi:hypothetical protein GCM10009741_79690 [Kribbella lupini]|uniref:Uncharacterized protein n=1 Tax=Kribbella lupini TaxID=291602 RepID=A0ABN2CU04_9ACTN
MRPAGTDRGEVVLGDLHGLRHLLLGFAECFVDHDIPRFLGAASVRPLKPYERNLTCARTSVRVSVILVPGAPTRGDDRPDSLLRETAGPVH